MSAEDKIFKLFEEMERQFNDEVKNILSEEEGRFKWGWTEEELKDLTIAVFGDNNDDNNKIQ